MASKPDKGDVAQSERFKEAARELGCDESEERFEAALKTIARQKPKPPPDKASDDKDDPQPGH